MESRPQYYRLNVARLTFREEVSLLPHGLRGYLSRRFGAARQAGGRFPILLLSRPVPLSLAEAEPSEEPPNLLARTVAQAKQLGFREPLKFLLNHPLSAASRPMILMRHASGNAFLRLYDLDRADNAISATFMTPLVDRGAVMTTTDRRAAALLPLTITPFTHPEFSVHPYSAPITLRLLWERHKRHVAEQPVAAPAPLNNNEEMLDFYNTLERSIFTWRDTGRELLIPLNGQETALLMERTETTRREQRRLRHGGLESALAFASLHSAFSPPPPYRSGPDDPIDSNSVASASTHGFARVVHRPLRQGGWIDAAVMSVVVFLLFGLVRRDAWSDATLWVALVSIFLLHGLGHAFGWRRVRVQEMARLIKAESKRKPIFRHLPAVLRHSLPETLGQDLSWLRAVAILLGPLPGLLAGSVLLTAANYVSLPRWMMIWGGASLGVNLLTLLPLPFLDGGRLLRLLLFGHFPWLAPVTRTGLVVVLAGVSLALQSLFMAMITILIAATLPYHCRMALVGKRALRYFSKTEERLARRCGEEAVPFVPSVSFTTPVIAVVKRVRRHLPHLVTPERISKVAHRLCETVLLRPHSWKAPVAGLALYGAALLLPLLPAICYLFQGRQMAELALIGGAYQRPRDPIDASARGMAVYIGMEEEAVVETTNGTRTPFPDERKQRPKETPSPAAGEQDRGPRLKPSEPLIEGSFSSWH